MVKCSCVLMTVGCVSMDSGVLGYLKKIKTQILHIRGRTCPDIYEETNVDHVVELF